MMGTMLKVMRNVRMLKIDTINDSGKDYEHQNDNEGAGYDLNLNLMMITSKAIFATVH